MPTIFGSHHALRLTLDVDERLDFDGDLRVAVEWPDDDVVIYLDAPGRLALVNAIVAADQQAAPAPDPVLVAQESAPAREAVLAAALDAAAAEDALVKFSYRKAADPALIIQRHVRPDHTTTTAEGYRIVVGHDQDREDVRAFRIDRIVGGVEVAA